MKIDLVEVKEQLREIEWKSLEVLKQHNVYLKALGFPELPFGGGKD